MTLCCTCLVLYMVMYCIVMHCVEGPSLLLHQERAGASIAFLQGGWGRPPSSSSNEGGVGGVHPPLRREMRGHPFSSFMVGGEGPSSSSKESIWPLYPPSSKPLSSSGSVEGPRSPPPRKTGGSVPCCIALYGIAFNYITLLLIVRLHCGVLLWRAV